MDVTPSPCRSQKEGAMEALHGGCWWEAGQRQSLRFCLWLGRAAGRIVPSRCPCQAAKCGTACGKAWGRAQLDVSRTLGWDGGDISQHRVKHFDNSPAETRQCQVVFAAVCSVSWYFTNPVVFGLKRKERNQKTKPWAYLKHRALGFQSDAKHKAAWPQWWLH